MNFLFEIGLNADDGILGVILHAARSLFYWISSLIYSIIPMLYNLFQDIAGAKLLTNEAFADITGKVGYLLGLIMLLIVIFDFIQLLIDPEKMFDKERGMFAIVKKIIFVLVGLGISTFVFNSLYWFQDYVLDNQILAKIILPSENANIDEELFGGVLAANTFSAFYTVRNDLDMSEGTDAYQCNKYRDLLINNIAYNNDFSAGNICINTVAPFDSSSGVDEDVFVMDYNFILQLIVGGMIVYLFVNYVITVGIRAVQLTVLQIIYPMALIGYLSPKKENIFTKWWKMYFSTYIDVFIRCGIIYFIVYLCALIMDSLTSADNEFWLSVSENGSSKLMIMVVMILALLTFAKKAPQLISSLLPAGDSKLGFGASWKDISGLTALTAGAAGLGITAIGRAPGMVVGGGKAIGALKKNWNESNDLKGKLKAVGKTAGAAALGVGGFALGGIGGAIGAGYAGRGKGLMDSLKAGQSNAAKANLQHARDVASGVSFTDKVSTGVENLLGIQTGYSHSDTQLKAVENFKSLVEGEDIVKDYKLQREHAVKLATDVQARFDNGDQSVTAADVERAKKAVRMADLRIKAATDAVIQATNPDNLNDNGEIDIIRFEYDGQEFIEKAITAVGKNDSVIAAKSYAEKSVGREINDRATLKNVRNELNKKIQENMGKKGSK